MTRTIFITGSTDGIGRAAAEKLVALGHKVLLHGRDADRLAQTQAEIGGAAGTYLADLSDMQQVQGLADKLLLDHDQIDVVINNAGILKTAQTQTAAGRDIRFDVNTIAPAILTNRLLCVVPQDGRVINLSSAAQAPVDIDAMTQFCVMDDMQAYAQSKLAITIWSQAMAEAYPNGPVFVAVNPGSLLATKMVQEGFGVPGKDVNIGADILVRAALSDEFASANGQYFDNDSGVFAPAHEAADDPQHVDAVMQALQTIVEPLC